MIKILNLNLLTFIESVDLSNFINFVTLTYNLHTVIVTANLIYFLGILGLIINRRNFLITMLFIEVMYVGIFVDFIAVSIFLNDPLGQMYALSLLVTVACESAVGLGILLVIFKKDNSINFDNFTNLRG